MNELYECSRCGVVSDVSGHLCQPKGVEGLADYCGTMPTRDICDSMHKTLAFECGTCGRPAEKKELLCDPHKIR